MHIQKVEIRNIKSIKEFDMVFKPDEPLVGWHVLIGDNGSGKSTVLKAIALALVGQEQIYGLNEDWLLWYPNHFTKNMLINIAITRHSIDKQDDYSLIRNDLHMSFYDFRNYPEVQKTLLYPFAPVESVAQDERDEEHYPNRQVNRNWFSTAYGPFRRFTGGSEEYDRIFKSNPKLAAHLSLFREDAGLTEVISWLQSLRFQELEARADGKAEGFFLDKLREFINTDDFLPYGVKLSKISSEGVFFTDAHGSTITIQNLSDGYRSILSLTLEMIRQMQIAYQTDDLFTDDFKAVKMPGVVLIDEVDAHLHPTWQRKIGFWFRQHFPNIQFIVTTHSPLICQAAAEGGSVWKLPKPGTDEVCVRVEGQDLNRLLYGNILEAYSTQLFGIEKRPEKSEEKLDRLAELNIKEVFEGLSREEKNEQEELRAMFPTASNKIEEHE